jgi:hypothetical protein
MPLTYRLASPDSYRIKFDGIAIGSVSKRTNLNGKEYWHWGVSIMPLMDHGGRPPRGNADSFLRWHAGMPAELW